MWQTVAATPELAQQFNEPNQRRMRNGNAHFAPEPEIGERSGIWELHPNPEIGRGGGAVYVIKLYAGDGEEREMTFFW
jgi:hypothetical protein